MAGQLASFTRLGSLRHFDFQFIGIDEIEGGDTEAARCDLLDVRACEIAVRVWLIAHRIFATFS